MQLIKKIQQKKARFGIVGLGYVGLPLAVAFAKVGFTVLGIEQNPNRKKMVNSGLNYITDVDDAELKSMVISKKLKAIDDFSELKKADVICICVPTPLDKNKQPNISYVKSVVQQIAKIIRKGQLIILESTTYPGTTEEIILPKLQAAGLVVGKDFFLAFSPERVDPGNKTFRTGDIPKVVGGVTQACSAMAKFFYSQIIADIFVVSSPKVAEMEKLLENIFRSVNIALVNELALLCKKMGIDIWEVIEAAKTKPYGYMPFYPGPGLGGHCIPLDPFYLAWKAKEYNMNTRFIELAGEVNDKMPEYIVQLVQDALNQENQSLKGAKLLILGIAYKKDIDDWRESPALKIFEILLSKGAQVSYSDPHISKFSHAGVAYSSVKLDKKSLASCDCAVIVTDHSLFDYRFIAQQAKLIVDTRNATAKLGGKYSARIVRI